jgi:hypothetical protein
MFAAVPGSLSSILPPTQNSSNSHRANFRRSSRGVNTFEANTSMHSFVRCVDKISQRCSKIFFTGRCAELRCPQLALSVFSNRPAYRMDLTLPAARQLLYALHEYGKLSDVVTLVPLFPLYNLPALSSDPISSALLISACLREARASGSESAWTMAVTLLPPFEQLLTETPPIPIPIPIQKGRFRENCWMNHAMLSILESLTVRGQDASRVREWCVKSGYELSSKTS